MTGTNMVAICEEKFEVIYSIIKFVSIFMMNCFIRVKKSAEMLFHYNSMFCNCPILCAEWMRWIINISVSTNYSISSSPLWVIVRKFGVAFDGAINLLSIVCKKLMFTRGAYFVYPKFNFSFLFTLLAISTISRLYFRPFSKFIQFEDFIACETSVKYSEVSHSISFSSIMVRASVGRDKRHGWLVLCANHILQIIFVNKIYGEQYGKNIDTAS